MVIMNRYEFVYTVAGENCSIVVRAENQEAAIAKVNYYLDYNVFSVPKNAKILCLEGVKA